MRATRLGDAAQWLAEVTEHGVCCSLVESRRSLGRHGKFEDVCAKTVLHIEGRSLWLEKTGLSVQLQEIKSVERHRKRPTSPVFRIAADGVVPRLATLRWDKTGKQCQAGQYAHVVFPTSADACAFADGMDAVQRHGLTAVLSGYCGDEHEGEADPTAWQVERGRERFQGTVRGWRGRKPEEAAWEAEEGQRRGQGAGERPEAEEEEEQESETDPFACRLETAEVHARWAEALGDGSKPTSLPAEELRELVFGGVPLKHRHALWPHWVARSDLGDIDELEAGAKEDDAKQIALDVPRTHNAWVNDRQRRLLSRVLLAYAATDPRTGYCQGMNFVAMTFIVLGFSEQVTLAGLCRFVQDICDGYHRAGLEGYLRDTSVLAVLVHHLLPPVHAQLEKIDIPLNVLALDHFISLSSRVWPVGAVARLWDLVLMEGPSALIASFVALLQLYLPRATGIPLQPRHPAGGEGARPSPAAAPQPLPDPADVMDRFKRLVRRGATQELDEILSLTRRWLLAITPEVVTRLRAEMLGSGDRA